MLLHCESMGRRIDNIVKEILCFSERQARRIVSPLIENGMLVSDSQKKPLRFGFPEEFMADYFPKLFNPEILGK